MNGKKVTNPQGPLIIAKVGSNAIAAELDDGSQGIVTSRVADLARGVDAARKKGYRVIVVTSGAVAAGMHQLGMAIRPGIDESNKLSALSAIGQAQLMHQYSEQFALRGMKVAQTLPTLDDFHRAIVRDHMLATINDILESGCVPIINENDFTSYSEMRFGDNDIIAVLVGILTGAEHLVLFTVENGIMSANPRHDPDAKLVEEIGELVPEMFDDAQESSAAGSGGVNSKLFAGDLGRYSGIQTAVTHVDSAPELVNIVEGRTPCSRFYPQNKGSMPIEFAWDIVKSRIEGADRSDRTDRFFTVAGYLKTIEGLGSIERYQ